MNENEALRKIKRNPKYFYSYANKFSKTKTKVGPLTNDKGETIKDTYEMAELLRKQYESTFSEPDLTFNIYNLNELFWNSLDDDENQDEDRNQDQEIDDENQDEDGDQDQEIE